ncbi:TPA: hypothetical protein DEA19_04265 [Candidatus Uhrbacteria bacterium]|nr:hypothetical protein [Candidatus Uhrbacteria bacterium]HBS00210.1 hypothetical protein [Candidatus Uhrbacteria bacterium]HCH91400.1 hypothetical protein [Candidatus Uhrbacteria bacterium]
MVDTTCTNSLQVLQVPLTPNLMGLGVCLARVALEVDERWFVSVTVSPAWGLFYLHQTKGIVRELDSQMQFFVDNLSLAPGAGQFVKNLFTRTKTEHEFVLCFQAIFVYWPVFLSGENVLTRGEWWGKVE